MTESKDVYIELAKYVSTAKIIPQEEKEKCCFVQH